MSSPFGDFFRRWGFNSDLRSYAHTRPRPRLRTHARTREKTNVCLKHPLETSACHDETQRLPCPARWHHTGTMAPHHTTPAPAPAPARDETGHLAQLGRRSLSCPLAPHDRHDSTTSEKHYHDQVTTCTRSTLRDCRHYHDHARRKTF